MERIRSASRPRFALWPRALRAAAGSLVVVLLAMTSSTADSQVVMLPTWRTFSVNTSVMVPDGGGVMLGGVTHGWQSCGTRGWGPWRYPHCQQGWGYTTSSVHATIIDHAAWDAAVLADRSGAERAVRWAGAQVRRVPAGALVEGPRQVALAAEPDDEPADRAEPIDDFAERAERMSLAEIRAELKQREAAAREQARAEALALMRSGDESRAAGRLPAARVAYRAALRHAEGELKTLLVARVEEVTQQLAAAKQATRQPAAEPLILGPATRATSTSSATGD